MPAVPGGFEIVVRRAAGGRPGCGSGQKRQRSRSFAASGDGAFARLRDRARDRDGGRSDPRRSGKPSEEWRTSPGAGGFRGAGEYRTVGEEGTTFRSL